jgi:hypothetical protein
MQTEIIVEETHIDDSTLHLQISLETPLATIYDPKEAPRIRCTGAADDCPTSKTKSIVGLFAIAAAATRA